MIDSQEQLYKIYQRIEVLQAASAPIQDIDAEYQNLSEEGDQWWYLFKGVIWMNLVMINFLCNDILIFISFKLRKIPIGALSSSFKTSFVINIIAAILGVISFVKMYTEYDEPGLVTRPEEKYYRSMIKARDGSFDINAVAGFFILYIMLRLLLQLVYNSIFGTLIQLMFKMVKDSITFLLIFFLLML